jgi:hypothetical protein
MSPLNKQLQEPAEGSFDKKKEQKTVKNKNIPKI